MDDCKHAQLPVIDRFSIRLFADDNDILDTYTDGRIVSNPSIFISTMSYPNFIVAQVPKLIYSYK